MLTGNALRDSESQWVGPTIINELQNTHELLIKKNSVALPLEGAQTQSDKMFLGGQLGHSTALGPHLTPAPQLQNSGLELDLCCSRMVLQPTALESMRWEGDVFLKMQSICPAPFLIN